MISRRDFNKKIPTAILGGVFSISSIKDLHSNENDINSQNIYEKLKSFKQFKEIRFLKSNNIFNPTIIILGDKHSNLDNLDNLIKIREIITNKILLGLEGWCGNEIDKKRKRLILNANNILTKKLLDKFHNDFYLFGIENEELQNEFNNRDQATNYYILKLLMGEINRKYPSLSFPDNLNNFKQIKKVIQNDSKFKDHLYWLEFYRNHILYFVKIIIQKNDEESIFNFAKQQYQIFKPQLDKYNPEVTKLTEELNEAREKAFIYNIIKEIKITRLNLCIIIIGKSHVENLSKKLNKEGFNIIIKNN